MARQILMAVDGSEKSFEAVAIMGQLLKARDDVNLALFHCVQQLASLHPGDLCLGVDSSCRLPFREQEKLGDSVLVESKRRLTDAGFPESRIQVKLKLDSIDPAMDILAEAELERIGTLALGRRGRGQLESLLLGSVSSKVAQYAQHRSVWIVDTPVHQTGRVLVAMEGAPECRELAEYTAELLAPIPNLRYTFLHLMPPVPPTFWDDGHILASTEQKDRQSRVERWKSDWTQRVEKFMAEARSALIQKGVAEKNVETLIMPTKEGVARDILNEIAAHEFQVVVMGKKSFHERKPFLMGSHAHKILQNAKGAVLCLVDN